MRYCILMPYYESALNMWTYKFSVLGLSFMLKTRINLVQYTLFTNELKTTQIIQSCSENVHNRNVLSQYS
jgi:hypothetical protein